jgi:hypothetical protein
MTTHLDEVEFGVNEKERKKENRTLRRTGSQEKATDSTTSYQSKVQRVNLHTKQSITNVTRKRISSVTLYGIWIGLNWRNTRQQWTEGYSYVE